MHSILFQLGPVTIYSYGVSLALAIIIVSWLVARDGVSIGISAQKVSDLVFWVVVCGIIGARSFYIVLNMNHYWREPLEMFMIWKGGLAWQGSFLAGFASGVIYLRRKKIPVRPFLDLVAVYIALGHAIGRVGCFLNGCCYGKPADWGIYFPVWQERLQPTQLYMVAGQLAIFMILRGIVPLKRYPGQVFVWYLLLSSLERFLVEFARADHELYAGLSIFQYVSLAIFLWALLLNAWWVRRAGKR